MSEQTPQLKRDSTMTATAEEGAAFLEKVGKVDESAKTRAQQKEIDETEPSPKLNRTSTMAATAKEGEELLDGVELGKTRAETDAKKQEEESKDDEQSKLQRASTMQITAKEGQEILEANGGVIEGTRSESKKIEEVIKASENGQTNGNSEVEEEKVANGDGEDDEARKLKRKSTMAMTAEEGEEFLKRQKVADSDEAPATEVEA
eukprot:gene15097-16654_t